MTDVRCALWVVACTALTAGCPRSAVDRRAAQIDLKPCLLSAPGVGQRLKARCAQVEVPENWEDEAGRRITLSVAVVAARRAKPAPDPLYFLAGGPGQAASEAFVPLAEVFWETRLDREVILVNQRGTAGSHPLQCDRTSADGLLQVLDPGGDVEWIARCARTVDADTRHYTTTAAVRDLDHVRSLLGHARINLYGVSYGTRVALTYMQRFPDRVRSAVLDGVVAQDQSLGPAVGRDARRALDMIFERCAADRACTGAFPDLSASFDALIARVVGSPPKVTLAHPITGERVELTLTRDMLGQAIRLLSYATETTAVLPLLIHRAHTTGDLATLAAQALIVDDGLRQSLTTGLELSVLCSEDVPFAPPSVPDSDDRSFLGGYSKEELAEVCALWPHIVVDADFKKPVETDAPTLLLSGELDPVTPPANAEQALKTLKRGRHVVVSGQGHGVVMRGCLPRLVARFYETADAASLETGCVQEINPSPFFIDLAGPEP